MKSILKIIKTDFKLDLNSLINSFKTTIACLIGFLLGKALHLAMPQWIIITILVVMAGQYRVGSAFKKGYSRLLATIFGAGLSILVLLSFTNIIVIDSLIFICIAVFIYFASKSQDYSYAYSLGAVTMVIILISGNPQMKSAIDRTIEIMLGVIIALLTTRLIFPIHSKILLRKSIAATLRQLREIYELSICKEKTFHLIAKGSDIEDEINQALTNQLTLIQESIAESRTFKFNKFKYLVVNRLERRLLWCIYMLHYTLKLSLKRFDYIIKMTEFIHLHNNILISLDGLAKKIQSKNYQLPEIDLEHIFQNITKNIRPLFDQYHFEDKNKIHSFLFCMDRLIKNITQLQKIITEL
jgi:uncharacterized membrane protein YgaE (UPF0421/DUF939 family)